VVASFEPMPLLIRLPALRDPPRRDRISSGIDFRKLPVSAVRSAGCRGYYLAYSPSTQIPLSGLFLHDSATSYMFRALLFTGRI
jgi:hypothetical protein